jgi:hypothetical protein
MRRGAFPWSMALGVLVTLTCSACGKVAGPQEGAAREVDAGHDVGMVPVDASTPKSDAVAHADAVARADAAARDAALDATTRPADADTPHDTGSAIDTLAPPDTGTPFDTGGPAMCVPSCQTDTDCQASCPAAAGAVQCCDANTSVCFESASATCPDETQPDVCNDPCTTDSQCQTLCTPPTGLVMCCDTASSACIPSTACPAQPADSCGGEGLGGGFPCNWEVMPDIACASACGDASVGSSYCCFGGSGACYLSPTAACP